MAVVYLNGRYMQAERAKVSAFDRGFSFGDGLFETLRAYSGWIFGLDRHLRRLGRGAAQIGLQFDGDVGRWRRVMSRLLRRNGLMDADSSLRLTVTRGVDILGTLLPPEALPAPTHFLVARPVEATVSERQQVGIGVVTIQWGDPFNPFGIKSLGYLYHMLAMIRAREQGAHEAIFVASDGSVVRRPQATYFVWRMGSSRRRRKMPGSCLASPERWSSSCRGKRDWMFAKPRSRWRSCWRRMKRSSQAP